MAEADIEARLAEVRNRIVRAGGDPDRITVVAVAKGFPAKAVQSAAAAGLADIGESYAQELAAKAEACAGVPLRWHFIGRLQRNKVRLVAPVVTLWQSVDRAELGEEIARRAPGANVLAQINVSGEPQKGGCPPQETVALVADLGSLGLRVQGLMAVGAVGPPGDARPGFRQLVRLADELGLAERSIGMTGDLEVAVEEGTTMLRVGTALFGPRVAATSVGN